MFRHLFPRATITSLVAVGALVAGSAAASAVTAPHPSAARSLVVRPSDTRLAYTGHWAVSASAATTVNPGSRLSFSFTGTQVTAHFALTSDPLAPEIYVTVDGHSRRVVVNHPVVPLATGLRRTTHTVALDIKSMDAYGNGWTSPLAAAVTVSSLDLGPGGHLNAPPRAAGLHFTFYGDSVSEGLLALSPTYSIASSDATRSFAALLSKAYRADGAIVGFAGQGITAPGIGNVPPAPQTFADVFSGIPAKAAPADAVIVHFGLNDSAATSPAFTTAYLGYLRQIRAADPHAWIFAVRPFTGMHGSDIAAAVSQAADSRIVDVNTTGWLNTSEVPDGLHPNAAGQRTLAAHLVTAVHAATGWAPVYLRP